MTHAVRYVVKDEHTLGYVRGNSSWMGVLSGSVVRGGHSPFGGPVGTFGAVIRDATVEDFAFFRVCVPPDFLADQDEVPHV